MGFCMKVWKSPRMSRPHGVPTAQERKLPQVGTHCLQDLQENAVRSPPRYQVVDRFLASLPVRRASSVCQVPPWGHVRSCPHIMPSLGHGPPSQSPTPHTPGLTGALLLVSVVSLVNNIRLLGHSLYAENGENTWLKCSPQS